MSAAEDTSAQAVLVLLHMLRCDGGTQARATMDQATIEAYQEKLDELPPVVVFQDDDGLQWLADGFHRVEAHRRAGRDMLTGYVRRGTQRDARLYACGANAKHGLPRSNEDKRRAVTILLEDDEWASWADAEIASACHVDRKFVRTMRDRLGIHATERTYQRAGKTQTMVVAPRESATAQPGTSHVAPEPDNTVRTPVEHEHRGAPLTDEMREGMRALYRAAADAPEGATWGDDAVRQVLADKYRVTRAEVDAVLASPEPAEREPIAAHVVEGIRSMARGGWSVERIARNYRMGVDEVNAVLSGAPLVVEECDTCGELETECSCDAESPSSDVEESDAGEHQPPPARDLAHDQWWTPPELAREMVRLAGVQPGDHVLEPSAGAGAIVEALLEAGATVEAHELDPRWASYLRICGRHDVSDDPRWTSGQVDLQEGNYLVSEPAAERVRYPQLETARRGERLAKGATRRGAGSRAFARAVINPPYKDGQDGLFLGRVLDEADVVVALLRVNALCGQGRYERVWSRHGGRCTRVLPLVIRPDFTGSDRGSEGSGAKSDFVVLVFGAEDLGERAPVRHLAARYGGKA